MGMGMGVGYDMYEDDDAFDSEDEDSIDVGGRVGVMPTRRAYARRGGGGIGGAALGGGGGLARRDGVGMRGGYGGPPGMADMGFGSPRMGRMGPGGLGPAGAGGMNMGMRAGMMPPGAQMLGNPSAHAAMMPSSPDMPPPGYSSMPQLPRYSAGGAIPPHPANAAGPEPGRNTYDYPASSGSSASTTPRRRTPSANAHIPHGAFAKSHSTPTPKLSRAHTSPAERIHRKTSGGNEWLKGDSFLDACICTTNCTCREGHRVLYRSRNDSGDEGQGEIRYILKKDLGRDCGDHTACRKGEDDGVVEEKSSKKKEKEKKKEEKKRKEEMDGFKEDLLEALDERFEKMRKNGRSTKGSSKAGSVGSPRMPFSGLGHAFPGMNMGMGNPAAGAGAGAGPAGALDPRMGDAMGGMPMGMGMNMPMTLGSGNPNAMNMPGAAGMNQRPSGIPDPMSGPRAMRPGQMPMGGMPFDDDMSIADMDAMGMGNPYLNQGLKSKALQTRFLSPSGRQDPGGMDREAMSYYRKGMSGPDRPTHFASRRMNRGQLPHRGGGGYTETEEFSPGPRRAADLGKRAGGKDRQDSFDKMAGVYSSVFDIATQILSLLTLSQSA